nr:GBS Bsp-like repeat-containing protein [Streptococcus macedonicus]
MRFGLMSTVKMTGLNGTTINVPKPSAKVTITKASATTYKVTVTDVPVYITSVTLPTWTENKEQDDIIWYKTTKDSTTTYSATISVAEHNLESGKYNVHVYGTSTVTNSLTGLLGTSFQGDYAFGDVAVSASLGQKGINITIPSDVSKAITVYHAVWSAKNDQDDIVWYKVPSNGELTAKYTGDYGKYLIHTYGVVNGRMIGLNTTSIDVVKPSISVDLTKVSETSVKVTISDVPAYMTSIVLPTWTENKGQDDIKWYQATKQSDGSYTYTFYAKNHNFESGHYNVHVYGTSAVTNSFIGLTATSGIDLTFSEKLTNPTVTVQNHNAANGTLQVVIAETETSKDIASVAVAAWLQAEQKNIHWYTTSSVVNGKVVVTVDEKYHHNISGDYTVHVYVKTTSGDTVGYALGSYALTKTQSTAKATTSYKGTGVYSVTISGVYSSGTVKYAVWSDTNGQDDIKWYDATTSGTTATGLINVANHSGTGTYHLHAYQSDNGQMYFLTSTDFTVKQTNYNTPYYNQRDGRWANTRYGYYTMASTGCVPTSLAMVFSALTNTEVLPTTVASYLYNNTVEFNRGTEGTTGNGILVASRQWGLTPTVLNSSSALSSALQEGHYVVAAVQQDKFSPLGYGTSHEIVLKGYSNGNTYVYDPYNSANNGWYPIASLWNEQSTQSVDTRGLRNPFVKITDI